MGKKRKQQTVPENVEYLDEAQLDYIEQVEDLLERARRGESVGCTIIEFAHDGMLTHKSLGSPPDCLSLVGALHMAAAQQVAEMARDLVVDELEECE